MLRAVFEAIYGECPYKSPTDMGVNMAGYCLSDDEACREASCQEILRRYFQTRVKFSQNQAVESEVYKIGLLMKNAKITPEDRQVAAAARKLSAEVQVPVAALQLEDGSMVTGKSGELLGACSALLLNAVKTLAGIDDSVHLISPEAIQPIQHLKTAYLGSKNPCLHSDEILIALSACASNDPIAMLALEQLPKLKGLQAHSSVMLSSADSRTFRRLGMDLTYEAFPFKE